MLSLFSQTHCTLLIQKPPTKTNYPQQQNRSQPGGGGGGGGERGSTRDQTNSCWRFLFVALVYFCTLGFGMAVKP
jgi:hypothetical protein